MDRKYKGIPAENPSAGGPSQAASAAAFTAAPISASSGSVPEITVRRATALDIDRIFKLTSGMAKKELMLSRSKYKIITMLNDFMVAEDRHGTILGCGAFSVLWTDLGEICALAVDDRHQKQGIGGLLVKALMEEGRRMKVPNIMALTYQVDFFRKMGFQVTNKDKFPRKVWRECLECPKLEECDETAVYLSLENPCIPGTEGV